MVSWNNVEKKLGKFSLTAGEGTINKGEVIGVLGENGIGKTTFVKILADVIKKDSGKLSRNVKVSYKPQYLESGDELVMVVLQDAIKKYTNQIINPLNIKQLYEKKLNELSGGERQRISIARALINDPEIIFADEPTGNLDSENGKKIVSILNDLNKKNGKTIVVVTHDQDLLKYATKEFHLLDGKIVSSKAKK